MKSYVAALAGSLVMLTAPALAQAPVAPVSAPAICTRPAPPAAVDGSTSSLEQMRQYRGLVAAFIADSDVYQACIIADLGAQRDAAKAAKTKFDKSVIKAVEAQLGANQKDKEAVGEAYNSAKKAYSAAHPS